MEKSDLRIKNCASKIKETVSNYTEENCIDKIENLLLVLKTRRSYLNLLFLQYTLMHIPQKLAVSTVEKHDGIKILEATSTSTNSDFLNSLLEIFIYLDVKRPILISILNSYDIIDKSIFHKYLNSSCGLFALFEDSGCGTHLGKILNSILLQEAIGNELEFIYNISRDERFDPKSVKIASVKEKFKSQQVYEKLNKHLLQLSKTESLQKDSDQNLHLEIHNLKIDNLQLTEKLKKLEKLLENIKNDSENGYKKDFNNDSCTDSEKDLKTYSKKYQINKTFCDINLNSADILPQIEKCEMRLENKNDKNQISPEIQLIDTKKGAKESLCKEFQSKCTISKSLNETPKKKTGRFSKKEIPKSKLETKKTYCGLKWKKQAKTKNSIFSKIEIRDFEAKFELEDFKYFEAEKILVEKKIIPDSPQIIQNIDPKKSYALNITLGRIKMSNKELYQSIINEEYKNENVIKQLLLYIPTPEEYDGIHKSQLPPNGRAEEFIKEIENLELFEKKLTSLKFKQAFFMRDYNAIISKNTEIFRKIIKSEELKNFMGCLLVIGNLLNANTFNGKAEAFDFFTIDAFKTKKIKELVSRKCNLKILKEELGDLSIDIPIDAIIQEVREIGGFYRAGAIDLSSKSLKNQSKSNGLSSKSLKNQSKSNDLSSKSIENPSLTEKSEDSMKNQKSINLIQEFTKMNDGFDSMVEEYKNLQEYLNVDSDDSFISKLSDFLNYFY